MNVYRNQLLYFFQSFIVLFSFSNLSSPCFTKYNFRSPFNFFKFYIIFRIIQKDFLIIFKFSASSFAFSSSVALFYIVPINSAITFCLLSSILFYFLISYTIYTFLIQPIYIVSLHFLYFSQIQSIQFINSL